MGVEDGAVGDIEVQSERMGQVNEFKYLRSMEDDRGTRKVVSKDKVMNGRRVVVPLKMQEKEKRV